MGVGLSRGALHVLLTGLIAATAAAPIAGDDSPGRAPTNEVDQLVGSLSDRSYETREAAASRLLRLGELALPAMEAASTSADPETRLRASRLLVELERRCYEAKLEAFVRDITGRQRTTLPGWEAFCALAGPNATSRQVYADLYRADTRLLHAAFGSEIGGVQTTEMRGERTGLSDLFESGVTALQGQAAGRKPDREKIDIVSATLATLYVAARRPELVNQRRCQLLTQVARNELIPVARRQGDRARVTRRLLTVWILSAKTNDMYLLSPLLQLADELQLKGAAPLAIAIASGERPVRPDHPQFRATALLTVGKLAGPDAIHELAPLLEDRAVCVTQTGRGGKQAGLLDVEIRDVALAVMLHLAGERPAEHGFEHAADHDDRLFLLHSLAFDSPEARLQALSDWRDQRPAGPAIRVAEGGQPRTAR